MVKAVVWASAEFEALHCWPEADALVSFLRNLHRHMFKVTVRVNILHYQRDVEFIRLKWAIGEAIVMLKDYVLKNPSTSCEHMASFLFDKLKAQYSVASIEVSEDGENGATLYYA